jgi:hypothetical protein
MRTLLVAAFILAGAVWGQDTPPQIALQVGAPGPVKIGDRIPFTLEKGPQKFELRNPDAQGNLIDLGWAFDQGPNGETFLIPLKAGGMVPSLQVWDVEVPPGKWVATTLPAQIQVEGLAEPAQQPEPMLPPEHLPLPWTLVALLVFLGVLALSGLVLLGRYTWLKWKAYRSRQTVGPPKSEDQEALDSLDLLMKEGLIQKGRYKPHYYRASDILKKYLGRRYDFDALESTSHELVTRMEDGRLADDRVIDRIEKLFEKLDLVKFTDFIPSTEEAHQAIEEIRGIVKSTRRIPAAESSAVPSKGKARR